MKQIKVYITPEQWAEKRLDIAKAIILAQLSMETTQVDILLENCGFCLLEKVGPETKPEQPQPSEIPTDKVEAVKYFLNQLPEGYRERALGQVNEKAIQIDPLSKNLKEALAVFNVWGMTNEKSGFWTSVYAHYNNPEKFSTLPPLPND